jgi:Fe-S-cluster-containing hydrogenase component 2
VKAIRVEDGYARVVPELCIMCGNCVLACPSNAKQVRDDLPRRPNSVESGRKVVASLGSFVCGAVSGVRPAN